MAIDELKEWLPYLGVEGIPKQWFAALSDLESAESGASHAEPASEGPSLERAVSPEALPGVVVPGVSRGPAMPNVTAEISPGMDWNELEQTALVCRKCRLCEGRNKVVFGVGKREQPVIAFVGEGPGADEDRVGEPFVGRAGALLTAAITNGLGLQREDVYIANVVKCRPPGNRAPLPDETESCTPYLYRQLELLQPQVIVTLGQPAQKALSGVDIGITKLRGQWQQWRGIRLMPTFHPAYILRTPAAKRLFWEDLQEVMRVLGLPAPKRDAAAPTVGEPLTTGSDEPAGGTGE